MKISLIKRNIFFFSFFLVPINLIQQFHLLAVHLIEDLSRRSLVRLHVDFQFALQKSFRKSQQQLNITTPHTSSSSSIQPLSSFWTLNKTLIAMMSSAVFDYRHLCFDVNSLIKHFFTCVCEQFHDENLSKKKKERQSTRNDCLANCWGWFFTFINKWNLNSNENSGISFQWTLSH